ncbi:MAG: hypothetical protein V1682_02905 [Candidatus Omnitrophota bacterium]
MKKSILSIIILTIAIAVSFADEGVEGEPAAKVQAQEEAQPAAIEQPEAAPAEQAEGQEGAGKAIKEVTIRTGASDSVTGKVESVKLADPLTRPRSGIVVVDAAGDTVDLVVKALAVVYDSTGHFLSLDAVQPGQEVQVDYIKKPGKVKEAASIKILK